MKTYKELTTYKVELSQQEVNQLIESYHRKILGVSVNVPTRIMMLETGFKSMGGYNEEEDYYYMGIYDLERRFDQHIKKGIKVQGKIFYNIDDWRNAKITELKNLWDSSVKRIKELYELIDHPDVEEVMCRQYDYMKLAYHPRVKKGIKIFLERKAKGQLESWELQAQ